MRRRRSSATFARRGRTGGSIINVSSTYGVVSPDQSIYDYKRAGGATFFKPVGYSVAKSGVLNFTRWLAEYGAPLGIRANTLVPGGVREAGHAPEFVAEYEKRTPLGRMANESDYNGAVLFLASRASVVHDRRHARRRRRLDGALDVASSRVQAVQIKFKMTMGEKDFSDRALVGDDSLSFVSREVFRAVRERRQRIRSRARSCWRTCAASTRSS